MRPPRLDGLKVGVFATRSPHRPCPIGLTLARLERIEGDTLHLTGIDLIDGTPILDIKPYIPDYDTPKEAPIQVFATDLIVQQMESLDSEEERDGLQPAAKPPLSTSPRGIVSGEDSTSTACSSSCQEVRTAEWLNRPPVSSLVVKFTPRAEEQLKNFKPKSLTTMAGQTTQPAEYTTHTPSHSAVGAPSDTDPCFLEVFKSPSEARQAVVEVLQQDPRSVYRRHKCSGLDYKVSIDNLNLTCWFEGNTVTVEDIEPKAIWERRGSGT